MKKVPVNFQFKNIKLWERKGFFQRLSITEEYNRWLEEERMLLKVLAILERKGKLPEYIDLIRTAMGTSHRNNSVSFKLHQQYSTVLDLNYLMEQLVN